MPFLYIYSWYSYYVKFKRGGYLKTQKGVVNEQQTFQNKIYSNTRQQYRSYQRTNYWNELRNKCFEYYNGKCADCNRSYEIVKMVIHHYNYDNLWNEIIGKDVKLICRGCHNKKHSVGFNSLYKNNLLTSRQNRKLKLYFKNVVRNYIKLQKNSNT